MEGLSRGEAICHKISKTQFHAEEKFRLVSDMVRAARSTPHNIPEGFGRFHYQENIQFCRHARGSLYEVKDQLLCSADEGLIRNNQMGLFKIEFSKKAAKNYKNLPRDYKA